MLSCVVPVRKYSLLPNLNNPEAVFEQFWKDFNEYYAIFDERGVNWDSMHQVYVSQIDEATTNDELFDILAAMIKPLDDGHVNPIATDKKQFRSNHIYRDSVGFSLWNLNTIKQNYLDENFEGEDSLGYVYGLIMVTLYIFISRLLSDNLPILDDV